MPPFRFIIKKPARWGLIKGCSSRNFTSQKVIKSLCSSELNLQYRVEKNTDGWRTEEKPEETSGETKGKQTCAWDVTERFDEL